MEKKLQLIDHVLNDLLEKFGEGKPTPGSGSAAALQSMLSAKLVQTVVSLTGKPKFSPLYDEHLPELRRWSSEIETRIYPQLKKLFQQDSDQFDEYIESCKACEKEKDTMRLKELNREKLNRLKTVTDNAVDIAKLAVEVGEAANYAFNHGFPDVRGDSAVALNGAVASVSGSLAIIELNLISFERDEWVWDVRDEIQNLQSSLRKLSKDASQCTEILEQETSNKHTQEFERLLIEFRSGRWEEVVNTEKAIEQLARDVQNVLWMNRDFIWKDDIPGTYIDILKPEIVLEKLLGYQYAKKPLGRFTADDGREYEVAGLIDKEKKVVQVSSDMRDTVRNFTTAHELGHALLHKGLVLHRDRPLDGVDVSKDIRERQADKFAAFFLMPGKLVRTIFVELFGIEKLRIDENTVFKLGEDRPSTFRNKVKDINGFAFYIAKVESFQGRPFRSLSQLFNVSPGAMAIRLRELDLIEF